MNPALTQLRFQEVTLASFKERRARRVTLHPRRNLVISPNSHGKSALLKSIYRTFGAIPPKLSDRWKEAHVASLVRFEVGGRALGMLHHQGTYAVFEGGSEEPMFVTRHVTAELAPFLTELLGVRLTFVGRGAGDEVPAPPAYTFLPFYVDQDFGWVGNWRSFERLNQFQGYRRDVAEYHAGIRPNEFYQLRHGRETAKRQLAGVNGELRALRSTRERLDARVPRVSFSIAIDAFEGDVEQLLAQCEQLAASEEEYRQKMRELRNLAIHRRQELQVARVAIDDVAADFTYASEVLTDEHIDCPVCGATYPNTFVERFEIARDEDRCRELVLAIESELSALQQEIQALQESLAGVAAQRTALERFLDRRQGDVRLKDLLTSMGREQVERAFNDEINVLTTDALRLDQEVQRAEKRIAKFGKSARRQEILDYYRDRMRANLAELDVQSFNPDAYARIDANINQLSGSFGPRALLAYYYAVLHTIAEYGTGVFAPIVIDSPNQQGQDKGNIQRMIEFIISQQPAESQLILGTESLQGIPTHEDTAIISFDRKFGALREEEYAAIEPELWTRVRNSFRMKASNANG